eukprot:5999882-Pleurochrysis_carterae.AAC.3
MCNATRYYTVTDCYGLHASEALQAAISACWWKRLCRAYMAVIIKDTAAASVGFVIIYDKRFKIQSFTAVSQRHEYNFQKSQPKPRESWTKKAWWRR